MKTFFTLVFATYLMNKSFHGGSEEKLEDAETNSIFRGYDLN